MRVWVIKTGEPVPYLEAEQQDRFLRAGQMARALHDAGHDVTWWTAQFHHQKKLFRDCPVNQPVSQAGSGPDMVFLQSSGYRAHIGLARLWDHAQLARNFRKVAAGMEPPDIIIAAWPTVELAAAAVAYGRKIGCPVVVDVRDLWPDIIYAKLNTLLPVRTDGFLLPYERLARKTFRGATGVTGLSDGMIDWARRRFGGQGADRVFHQSMSEHVIDVEEQKDIRLKWKAAGVDLDAPKTRLVWSGSLVPETDGVTLLKALEQLSPQAQAKLDVVLCGTGSLTPQIEETAKRVSCLTYAGWVDAKQLKVLVDDSHIGLLCYLDRFDFQNSIPNKVVDYSAGSMRILTNLSGEVPRMFEGTDTIVSYPTGDPAALANVLTQIAENEDKYRVKHAQSRDIFNLYFNANDTMKAYIHYLETLSP